jgi:kumamolisin
VSVGGTSLHLNANNTISRETAWKLSGGGRFKRLQRARWQLAQGIPKDRYRWVPDVAFLGDPRTGVKFVDGGAWHVAAGTSLGAPAWTAIWALVLQQASAAGKAPDVAQKAIYRIGNSTQYTSAFHDIVTGSNGRYHAGKGWDPVTGWGTPNVAALADAIVAQSPP